MSKGPSPKLDRLRALREEGFAARKAADESDKSPADKTAETGAEKPGKKRGKKSIPVGKLNASNDT